MVSPGRNQVHLRRPRRPCHSPGELAGAVHQGTRPGKQRYVVREGVGMLKSLVVAHQGNDEAIMRFEDKTVLRQVDGDAVLI